jgi:hypothetical protein
VAKVEAPIANVHWREYGYWGGRRAYHRGYGYNYAYHPHYAYYPHYYYRHYARPVQVNPYITGYSAAGVVAYPIYRVEHYRVDYANPVYQVHQYCGACD